MTYIVQNFPAISPWQQIEQLLGQIRSCIGVIPNVKIRDEVNSATESIEVLKALFVAPVDESDFWPGVKLTKLNARLLGALRSRLGMALSRDALCDALYFDAPGGGAGTEVIDVFVCKLRKQLVGSGYEIQTAWGIGYKMVKTDETFANRDALQALRAA